MPPLFFFLFPNRFLNVLDCPIAERKEEKKTVQTDCYSNEERARSYTSRTYKKKKKKFFLFVLCVTTLIYVHRCKKAGHNVVQRRERERDKRRRGDSYGGGYGVNLALPMLIRSSASHNALDSEKRTFLHPPIGQKMKKVKIYILFF